MDGIFKSISSSIANNPKITLVIIIILIIVIVWLYLKNKYGNIGFFNKKDKNINRKVEANISDNDKSLSKSKKEEPQKESDTKETKEVEEIKEIKEKKRNVIMPDPIITQLVRDINHN
jgi:predicted Holliday junction resolvase-like endonuclease